MGLSGGFPHSWRSWVLSHLHFHLQEKSRAEKVSLGPELCHLEGRIMRVKSNCSSSKHLNSFIAPKMCWKFSTGNPDFHKGALVCGWLSKIDSTFQGFPHCSREGLELVCRPLQGPSQDLGLYAYKPMHGQERFLPGCLAIPTKLLGVGSLSSHQVISVCIWIPNCWGWRTQMRESFFSHADVTSEAGRLLLG